CSASRPRSALPTWCPKVPRRPRRLPRRRRRARKPPLPKAGRRPPPRRPRVPETRPLRRRRRASTEVRPPAGEPLASRRPVRVEALGRSVLRPRTGTAADLLVLGLGNPGAEYAGTRHNVGADVVELLATRHGERLRKGRERALVAEVRLGGRRMALAFPQTYVNDSGLAAAGLIRRFGIPADGLDRLVVVHDELDLPVGRLQVKLGGGLAGHNRLKAIQAHPHSHASCRALR